VGWLPVAYGMSVTDGLTRPKEGEATDGSVVACKFLVTVKRLGHVQYVYFSHGYYKAGKDTKYT
jgi:hypothetical protein